MKSLIFSTFILFSLISYSQDGPKVVVFNSSTNQEKPVVDRFNLFKISLLEPLSGDISFYYERILNQNVSIEGGLGFTIDDYISGYFDDTYASNPNRTALIGNSFGLGLRYYPYVAGQEFYFAPEFKYRFYHSDVSTTPIGSGPVETFEETKSMSNFRVTVGYVYLFDDRIFIDFYGGIGLAMIKTSKLQATYDDVTGIYTNELVNTRTPKPRLSLGIKFGLNF